jgi:ABC-2 type transport system permease protein
VNLEQLKAVLQLRWQLTRNQWSRSRHGVRGAVAIIILLGACFLGALCFLGAFLGAAYGMGAARSESVMLVWFFFTGGFLIFWTLGLLTELQRSEAIDLQRLMHLPVKLGQIFFINYVASHFVLGLIIAVPAVFGLSAGMAIARGPIMLLMLPLSLAMITMITAWTYCLRGWLTALMTNPRRRRSIIAALTFAFVVIAQLPNLYFNVFSRPGSAHRDVLPFTKILAVQKFLPPFWVSLGAKSLADGRLLPAMLGTLGCLSIGALGLRRAYGSTLKFYHGEASARSSAAIHRPQEAKIIAPDANRFLESRLPGVPDEASAVALASFRSMLRAPEIKMAWGMSLAVPFIVGASIVFRSRMRLPDSFKPLLPPMVIGFSFFTLVQFLSNQFGFDREGFQTYVLSPMNRRALVFGKNLAAFPVMFCSGLFWLILSCVFIGLPALTAVAVVFQIVSMAMIAAVFGNLISMYLPYRVRAASLKPTKLSGGRGIVVVLAQLFFPFLMIPVFIAPGAELLFRLNETAFPINLTLSFLIATAATGVYFWSLPSYGQLLQQREIRILETLTAEVE